MGWSIGFDDKWKRDIGYGVPAFCDHPDCNAVIDRGLAYVCGGEPYGGEHGCGLYFCDKHMGFYHVGANLPRRDRNMVAQLCKRCRKHDEPFTPKPDHPDWIRHKLTDDSWQEWRDENPEAVKQLQQ